MKYLPKLIVAGLLLAIGIAPGAPIATAWARQEEAELLARSTPEGTLRTFLIALLERDARTLRAVTLPLNASDFTSLLRSEALPAATRKEMRRAFTFIRIHPLKAGETVVLPGNRKYTVPAGAITADRLLLLPQGAPTPTELRRVQGTWRVDAAPFVAGRKASERARHKG